MKRLLLERNYWKRRALVAERQRDDIQRHMVRGAALLLAQQAVIEASK